MTERDQANNFADEGAGPTDEERAAAQYEDEETE